MLDIKQSITHSHPYKAILLLLLGLLLPLASMAETLYVGDKLRVGVRAKPSSKAPSLTIVSTGTAVEVLQRKKHFLKIRTPNGTVGWVKGAYFTEHEPARLKLRKIEAQLRQQEHELQSLREQYQEKQRRLEQLSQQLASAQEENRLLERQRQQITTADTSPPGPPPVPLDKNKLGLAGATVAGMLGLGFLLGIWWHRRAVARRLGGITL